MALKFKCEHCDKELIVYYLKIGEVVQCTNCNKKGTVPETAEFLELSKPMPQLIMQDERAKEKNRREEIIRTPSVRFTKFALDVVWYVGIFFIAFCILGKVVGGVIDVGLFSDSILELPITIQYHELTNHNSLEDAGVDSREEGIVLYGHTNGFYKISGGKWPLSVVVDMILSALFVMGATCFLRKIFRSILDNKPFSKQNSVDLRRVGYIIALWGPVNGTFKFIQGAYYLPYIKLANAYTSVDLHLYPKLIIVGMVIIVIAHLFEIATRIQHENELTI